VDPTEQMINTATYTGSVVIGDLSAITRSGLIYPEWRKEKEIRFTIRYSVDDAGNESVSYSSQGGSSALIVTGPAMVVEIPPKPANPYVRPASERGGYATMGFVLPPSTANIFYRPEAGGLALSGDTCKNGESQCQNAVLAPNFHSAVFNVTYDQSARGLRYTVAGSPMLEWKFGPGKFPSDITYAEHGRDGAAVATATYKLLSVRESAGELDAKTAIPQGTVAVITKQGNGFGHNYDKNEDPWEFYNVQKTRWAERNAQLAAHHGLPWATYGASAVVLGLVVSRVVKWRQAVKS
jgi:hypothetical protein